MNNQLIGNIDKALGTAGFKTDDVETGIYHYEKYIKYLQNQIEQNSDNEKYTIEKNNTISEYKKELLSTAQRAFSEKDWIMCLKLCQLLIKYNTEDNSVYKHASFCLKELKQFDTALELIKIYAKKEPDDKKTPMYMGDICSGIGTEEYGEKAVEYYKEYLKSDPDNPAVYNAIGSLYAAIIDTKSSDIDRQMQYFNKALELSPDNKIVLKNIQLSYSKKGDIKKATEICNRIYSLYKDSFSNDDYYDYAAFQIRTGNFLKGWKLLEHRFEKETSPTYYPTINKPKWDGIKNISNKTLLIHCEQGFGDVIMFSRFTEQMKKYAKRIVAVVQDELIDLFKESKFDFPIYPRSYNLDNIDFDYHIPLISLPRILKLTPNSIPKTNGYLSASTERFNFWKNKMPDSKKFKIGICFAGADSGKKEQRDIDWKYIKNIADINNVELYCLKKDLTEDDFRAIDPSIKITCFNDKIKNFADTAAIIKNLDLVISTDNVILNLSGALGVKTFGLFNVDREYRWYGVEEGKVIWYDSVTPFQAKRQNDWEELINRICPEIKALAK